MAIGKASKTKLAVILAVLVAIMTFGAGYAQAGILPPVPGKDCIFEKMDMDITPQAGFSFRVADGDAYQFCQLVIFDVNGYRTIKAGEADTVYDISWVGDRLVVATNGCPICTAAMTVYAYEGYRVADNMYMPAVFK